MAAIKATVDELKSSEDVVKEEVDGLNKEVDDILKKLGELLAANAVVQGDLRIANLGDLRRSFATNFFGKIPTRF